MTTESTVITSFHQLSNDATKEMINSLLTQGYNIDEKDSQNFTPLYNAICHSHFNLATLLVEFGADLEIIETDISLPENTPLEFIDLLSQKEVDFCIYGCNNFYYNTILGRALETKRSALAKLLIPKISTRNIYYYFNEFYDETPKDILIAFFQNGFDINYDFCEIFSEPDIPLTYHVKCGNLQLAKCLIEEGADLTPPHLIALRQNIFHIMTEPGYYVSDSDYVFKVNANFITLLIHKDINIHQKDARSLTPLQLAFNNKNLPATKMLLSYGAKIPNNLLINIRNNSIDDQNNNFSFILDFPRKQKELKKMLTQKNWNKIKELIKDDNAVYFINSSTEKDTLSFLDSLVIHACKFKKESADYNEIKEIFQLLREKRIYLHCRNSAGKKPIDYAFIAKRKDIADLLFCPSEVILRDLLINTSDGEIRTVKFILTLALAKKLVSSEQEIPLLFSFFFTRDPDIIKTLDPKSFSTHNDVTIKVNVEDCIADITYYFDQLKILEKEELTPEITEILDEIEKEAEKSLSAQLGLGVKSMDPIDIASTLFSLAYGHAWVRKILRPPPSILDSFTKQISVEPKRPSKNTIIQDNTHNLLWNNPEKESEKNPDQKQLPENSSLSYTSLNNNSYSLSKL